MHNLNAHCSNQDQSYQITFGLNSKDEYIHIDFNVFSKVGWYTSQKYDLNGFDNWGLWDFDVVEAFMSFNGKEYIELQVSPLNQKFALKIIRPREEYNRPDNLYFESDINIEHNKWISCLRIKKSLIPGFESDHKLVGNFHAILGENREHYSFNVNSEEKPDFHRRDLFVELPC